MIKKDDIEHLATLGRIAILPEEQETFRRDIEHILAYVSELNVVVLPKEDVSVRHSLRNVLRSDDVHHKPGVYTDVLLASAPARVGDRVAVKKIL